MSSKKIWSILAATSLVVGLLAFAAPSALATHDTVGNVVSLMPDADAHDDTKDQLTDRFDGTDSAAHLTAIAEPDTTQVSWYVCPNTGGASNPFDAGTGCELIGTDTSGVQPIGPSDADAHGGSSPGSAEAYEFFWNIDIPDGVYDVVVAACAGTPAAGSPSTDTDAENCALDEESGITVDDAAQTSTFDVDEAGEITLICTDRTDDPGTAEGPCEDAADYSALEHGDLLDDGPVTIRFTTNTAVSPAIACAEANVDVSEGARTEPGTGAEVCDTADEVSRTFTTVTWEADLTLADEETYDLLIAHDADSSGTLNTGDVVLDEHWVTTAENVAATFAASFEDPAGDTATNDVGCQTDEVPDLERTNIVAEGEADDTPAHPDENLEACSFDQAGDPFLGDEVTFEVTGPAQFEATTDCLTVEDPDTTGANADTRTQRAICTTGTDGEADVVLDYQPASPNADADQLGDAVITVCRDADNDGCADETDDVLTLTKHYVGETTDIDLVFSGEGTAAEQCDTGDKFRTNTEGDTDTLLVCTYDENGNLTGTQEVDDENNNDLAWNGLNTGAVAPTQNPPDDTGADGTATLGIRAINEGSATITVTLVGDGSTSSVTKTVQEGEQRPECNDGIDNDGDGFIDHPDDPGCTSLEDNTESPNPGGGGGPIVEGGPCSGFAQGSRTNNPVGGEIIVGTDGNDILVGTDGDDIICALGGNDIVDGGPGEDQITGNAGDDTVEGGTDKDQIRGGTGNDALDGGLKNDVIFGGGDNDTIRGNRGWDFLKGGRGMDQVHGGRGNDVVNGSRGHDELTGFTGNDDLNGGRGRDSCRPGQGNDTVKNCERR